MTIMCLKNLNCIDKRIKCQIIGFSQLGEPVKLSKPPLCIDKLSFRKPQQSGDGRRDRQTDRQNLANMSHIKLDTYLDYFRFMPLNENKLT